MPDAWDQWLAEQSSEIDGQIRRLVPEDLEELLRIIRLHDSDDYRAARQMFDHYDFESPVDESAFFVLHGPPDDADQLQPMGLSGYWAGDAEADRIFWLDWTYVSPFYEGRGYGSALLECVLVTLEQIEARKLFVATSSLPKYERAVGFYRAHGFEHEGRLSDYYAEGEDQLLLGRTI